MIVYAFTALKTLTWTPLCTKVRTNIFRLAVPVDCTPARLCTLTDVVILVQPREVFFSVAPQILTDAHHCYANTPSLYALELPTHWVTPMMPQMIIPLTPGASSPSAPAPPPPPPPPPRSQTTANDRLSGTQKEDDLALLEQNILSSPWYAANALEPTCGSPECPYVADCHGVRGMSCYTAFVITRSDGTFGCWREECSAYSTRQIENAVKHQRTNHFNHKPFLCVSANITPW